MSIQNPANEYIASMQPKKVQWWRWIGWSVVGCVALLMLSQYGATHRPEITRTASVCNMNPGDVATSANQLRQSLQQGGVDVSESEAAGYIESIAQATKSSAQGMGCPLLFGLYRRLRINQHLTHAEAITSILNGLGSMGEPKTLTKSAS